MKNNKKGISEIVSTVLIVMIAIAAVGVIAGIVVPMVRDSFTSGQACFKAVADITLESDMTCKTGTTLKLAINKGSDSTIEPYKVQVWLYKNDGTRDTRSQSISGIKENEKRYYDISEVESNYTHVQITPIIKIGEKERVCQAPENKIRIVECTS